MLDKLLGKARQGLDEIKEFAAGEHEISLSQETLKTMADDDDRILERMQEAGAENLDLEVVENGIMARGRFKKEGVSGEFEVRLEPDEVVWEKGRHEIWLRLADQDVEFDRSFRGVMADVGAKVASGLFGWDVIGGRMKSQTDAGRVKVCLDGTGPVLDTVLASIRVTNLECRPGKVVLTFRPDPKHAMANARELLTWWKGRDKGASGK
jgi:hypothetical protein